MNRLLVVITNRKKLSICLFAILFIILSALIISNLNFSKANLTTDHAQAATVLSPENVNKQLRGILSSIVPSDNKILFENSNRGIEESNNLTNLTNVSLIDILKKGKNLAYNFVYSNEEYLRPIYSSTWKQGYYQGWLYLPRKIISARHSLFTYRGGSSEAFDIEGELGFYPNISIDNQNYVNLLIYNFDLQNVIQHENQIVISGIPAKRGVQIISLKNDDVAIQMNDKEEISVYLCTPNGYEIDYQNIKFTKASDEVKDFGTVEETYSDIYSSTEELDLQNALLIKELSYYISDSSKPIFFQHNGSYQTSDVLNTNIDLEDATKYSSEIKHNILYNDQKFIRPVFHPQWKQHYEREWCYIPRKMYINMKELFVLPSDKEIANDLCGELGFFKECPVIKSSQVGLLINNFTVSKISLYENNILVEGAPSRAGIQIVSIAKTNLTKYKEYSVRLVTKDLCELDIDVYKN